MNDAHELIEFFILGEEPCIGIYENKIESILHMSVYEFQEKLVKALDMIQNE